MTALRWLSRITSGIAFLLLLVTLAAPGDAGQTAILGAIGLAVIPWILVQVWEKS